MQTSFRLPVFFFIAALILFTSCSKTNKEGRFIPKTATMAMVLNSESLLSKLPWEEIKQNQLFKELYADSSLDAYIKTALDNPENTGIDVKKKILFFFVQDTAANYGAIEGMLKDAEKFKQFSGKFSKSAATEKDGIYYVSDHKMTAAWDKEKFVIVANESPKRNEYQAGNTLQVDAAARAAAIFALTENNSLAKEEKFTELMGKKGDLYIWVNIGEFKTGSSRNFSTDMLRLNKFSEGSKFAAVANFENGKIDIDCKSYSGKEMTELNRKYGDTKINSDMIKRIPAKEQAFLFALSYKPEGFKELINLAGVEGLANIGLAKYGLNMDDFLKANKGDILFSIADIKKDSSDKMKVQALFATAIGDKNSFGKLVEAGHKLYDKDKVGGQIPELFYNLTDNYFALGTDKLMVDKYVSTANNSSFDFMNKIESSSFAVYMNFKYLLATIPDRSSMDSLELVALDATARMWDNAIATGHGFENGGNKQHIEINLVDKSTNSLKQLNNYLGTLGMIHHEKKLKREKWMNDGMDSISSPKFIPEK